MNINVGNPFNVYQYHILHKLIAQIVGLEVGTYVFNMGNAHIYDRHEEGLRELLTRDELDKSELEINISPLVDDINEFKIEDVSVKGLNMHPFIQFEIAE